jgi:transposase
MSTELSPDVLTLLADLRSDLRDLRAELAAFQAELRSRPAAPAEPRARYSVEEVAEMLGRPAYTVREWCRHGQINASKRAERRGGSALWCISADEITRYRNERLLQIDPDRNNRN